MLSDEDKLWINETIAALEKRLSDQFEIASGTPADVRQRTRESITDMRLISLEQRVTYLEIRTRPHPEDK